MDEAIEEKFTKAYEEYADGLFAYCCCRVSNRDLAKDILQDTFTKTWAYIGKYGPVDNLKAFLYRTAANLIIDYYRKRRTVSLEVLEEAGFEPGMDDTDRWIDQLDGAQAAGLLHKLPKRYEEAVTLRYLKGLSVGEIAAKWHMSKNAVSVLVHRAVVKLRGLFYHKIKHDIIK